MSTIFVCATVFSTKISYIAIAFLSFAAFREFYSLLGFRQSDRRAIFWAFLAIPVQYYLAYIGWYGLYIVFIPVIMFLFLPLRLVLKGDTKGIVKSMSTLQWILMLTVFGISHMAYLLSLPEIEGFSAGGRGLLLFLVFLTEINDVMQFVWGKLLGRHKIIPKISPNKTWEGFIGGVISTTAIGYGLGFLTPLDPKPLLLVSFLIAIVWYNDARDWGLGIRDWNFYINIHVRFFANNVRFARLCLVARSFCVSQKVSLLWCIAAYAMLCCEFFAQSN